MSTAIPIKYIYQIRDERLGTDRELEMLSVSQYQGVVPRSHLTDRETRAADITAYKVVEPDDIVINRMLAYKGALGIAHQKGIVSPEYIVMRSNHRVDAQFLTYLLKSEQVVSEMSRRVRGIGSSSGTNVRTPRINPSDLGEIPVHLPEIEQQRSIVDYLDNETSRIGALMSLEKRRTDLLRERRKAIITELVADEHLANTAFPIKYAYQIRNIRLGANRDLEMLSVSEHQGVVPRSQLTDKETRAEDITAYKVVAPGDIAINRMLAYKGALGIAKQVGIVSPAYIVLRANPGVEARYLTYLLKSSWFVGEMTQRLRGIGSPTGINVRTPTISPEDLGGIPVRLPDQERQRLVADYLDRETYRIDSIIELTERLIELQAEYQKALITTVVTGEHPVPEVS